MIEYTLKTVSDDITARAKTLAVYTLVFILGALAMFSWISTDPSIHVVQLGRDCHTLKSFEAEGRIYYCAPWIYEEPKP